MQEVGICEKNSTVRVVTEASVDGRVCILNCHGPLPTAESRECHCLNVWIFSGFLKALHSDRPPSASQPRGELMCYKAKTFQMDDYSLCGLISHKDQHSPGEYLYRNIFSTMFFCHIYRTRQAKSL